MSEDISISKNFGDDVELFCESFSTASNDSVFLVRNINNIQSTASGIPSYEVEFYVPTSLDDLRSRLDALVENISSLSEKISSAGALYTGTLTALYNAIKDIETSDEIEDKGMAIINLVEAFVALNELYNESLNGTISRDIATMIEQYFNGECSIETLSEYLNNVLESNTILDSEMAENLTKLIEKVSNAAINKTIGELIKLHFGNYGFVGLKAAEGLIFKSDPGIISRVVDGLQVYARNNDIKFFTKLSESAKDNAIHANFIFNFTVAMITDYAADGHIDDLGSNIILSLYGAACTKWGAEIGTIVGGPAGTVIGGVAGAAVDVIGSVIISQGLDQIEEYQEFWNFSIDDLREIQDTINQGYIDDEHVPPGTTLYDAAYLLREAGFPSEVNSMISEDHSNLYLDDGVTLKPEIKAIIRLSHSDGLLGDAFSGPMTEAENEYYQRYREICDSDSRGTLRAYVNALTEHYESTQEGWKSSDVSSQRPDSIS